MPQEQLKPSFEQAAVSPSLEKLASSEKLSESAPVEVHSADKQPISTSAIVSNQASIAKQDVKMTPRQIAIDDILEDGLAEIYVGLAPDKQKELKQSGEKTVRQIDQLLGHAKSQLTKIIGLIRQFLLIIPGVNHFFLEQEVKIKTDKIMDLKDK